MYDWRVGVEKVNPYEELKKLDEQIESAAELAALKPVYARLNEILQALPDDFDLQLAGTETKQRVMARGLVLKQQQASAPASKVPASEPFSPAPAATAENSNGASTPLRAPHPPGMPAAESGSLAPSDQDDDEEAPAAPREPTMILGEPMAFPLFPVFATATPPPEPPSPPASFAETGAEPVVQRESTVMTAAPPMPVSFPVLEAAPAEQPSLSLVVAAELPPEPPAPPAGPPAPETPDPPAPPVLLPDAVASEPAAPSESPGAIAGPPEPPALPLFDSALPAELPPALVAAGENPPEPSAPPVAAPVLAEIAQPAAPTSVPDVEAAAPAPVVEAAVVSQSPPSIPRFEPALNLAAPPALAKEAESLPEPPKPLPVTPAMPSTLPAPPIASLTPEPLPPAAPPEPPAEPVAAPLPPAPAAAASAAAQPPPPPPAVKPETPPPPARPPVHLRAQRAPFPWNRAIVVGPALGLLAALVVIFLVVHHARERNAKNRALYAAAVPVDISTAPAGATVKIVAEGVKSGASSGITCKSNCQVALTPGAYQISASLDGFDPARQSVVVKALHPAKLSLTLLPQAESVRLLTDLDQGKVVVDDRPPVDLQEGQLVIDKVAPGAHTVKIAGKNGDASFSFQIADARMPAVTGPVSAHNMIAVVLASFGKQARIVTSAGPWKLAVNGQPQGEVGPAGTDLIGFQPGVNEIVVGEGKDQRNMSESFGAAPMLTAFLKTDVNAGTLIVSVGLDGVRVFLNGKEYPRTTQRGQLRLPILGKVSVRVAKSGFQDEPAQSVEVKKGAEARLQFNLKPQPQFASLEIRGALAGTEVLVDQKIAGTVGPDGLFNLNSVSPGDHTIELRREQYQPKRLQRSFRAGQAVALTAADAVLISANGTVRINRSPASATVSYRRGEDAETHEVHGSQIDLPPGTYTFAASAPGFLAWTTRVQLASGESKEVAFTLAGERVAPPPAATGMADFEDAQSWTKEGDSWVHKGGGFVPFKLPAKGVFTFKVELLKGGGVFRAGQIRWCVEYLDAKNYLLYEIDRKNFWAGVIQKGKRFERVKTPHNLGNQKAFTIQIEVAPDRLVQKVRVDGNWKVLDTFTEPGRDFTQGKFGFLIQGNDEIAISDFKFQPR